MSQMKSMNSRPIRPTPSRKSDFLPETPKVIYSQAAADFRPPADYVGPKKSFMGRPPDPSMNPNKKPGFPVLSVSRLDIPVPVPPSSQTSLPRVEQKNMNLNKGNSKYSSPLLECEQIRKILCNMPQSFRKLFRSELRHKRPIKGSARRFIYRDFHDASQAEQPNLHGILLLGGNHRELVEEVQQEPGTPPPLSGRKHCIAQTETYLEDIADNETGFISTEMQCEPIHNELIEAPPPLRFNDEDNMVTTGTQLDHWVFSDVDHAFDQLATNVAEAVIMESLKQLQEEFELDALRKQHEYHKCLRNREMSILVKYKSAQEKYEEQKKLLDSRLPWDQTLDQIIQLVGFDKIRDLAPEHFIGSQTAQAVFEHIQGTMIPPMNMDVEGEVDVKKASRRVLDTIIEESVLKREAEFAGKMYIRDPRKKGSLATDSPSRMSINYDEWMGEELEDEYDDNDQVEDFEIPEYSNTDRYDYEEAAPISSSSASRMQEVKGELDNNQVGREKRSSESSVGSDEQENEDGV